MKRLRQFALIIGHMGVRWALFRLFYCVKLKSGLMRCILPCRKWSFYTSKKFLPQSPNWNAFLEKCRACERSNAAAQSMDKSGLDSLLKRADSVSKGEFELFSDKPKALSIPPDWHLDCFQKKSCNSKLHWTKVRWRGDIKNIWELSRFSWIFALARAIAVSDADSARKFESALEILIADWMENNPPNSGANWMCGQESAMRVCALIFAMSIARLPFLERNGEALMAFIGASAERIEKNLSYAVSQKNNHGISEASGLYVVGSLFPEFRDSQKWKDLGLKWLKIQCRTLFFKDGSFSQYSTNYHRVALDGLLMAAFAADISADALPKELLGAMEKSLEFLSKLCNQKTGTPPRYGADDGARFLQLSESDYFDFRPLLGALAVIASREVPEENSAYKEEAAWLFGKYPKVSSAISREDLSAKDAGYYSFNTRGVFAFIRCGNTAFRFGHSDTLSLWIELDSKPIAVDAGTFSYCPEHAPQYNLACASVHNVLSVREADYAVNVGPFLRLPPPKANLISISRINGAKVFFGESRPYLYMKNPPVFRRLLICLNDAVIVVDSAISRRNFRFELNWLLNGTNCREDGEGAYTFEELTRIKMASFPSAEKTLAIGGPAASISPRYNKICDAAKISSISSETPEAFFCTTFSNSELQLSQSGAQFQIIAEGLKVEIDASKMPRAKTSEEFVRIMPAA